MLVEVATGMRRHPGIKCLSDADSGIGWKNGIPDVRLEHATSCWRSSWAVPRFERCDEYVLSLTSPRVWFYQAECWSIFCLTALKSLVRLRLLERR